MKIVYISLLLFFLSFSPANSATLKEYYEFNSSPDAIKVFRLYLKGLGEGVQLSNVIISGRGDRPFVCIPDAMTLSGFDYSGIFEEELRTGKYDPEELVSIVLLSGLVKNFPCN